MSYFGANGQPLGATPEPPQAAANGVGRYFGYDDPQAAANGLGRHPLGRHRLGVAPEPPQAQANGLGARLTNVPAPAETAPETASAQTAPLGPTQQMIMNASDAQISQTCQWMRSHRFIISPEATASGPAPTACSRPILEQFAIAIDQIIAGDAAGYDRLYYLSDRGSLTESGFGFFVWYAERRAGGVSGLGRFDMIGMLPPQAQAGVGDDTTPSGVPEGPMRSWRDGVFGARRPPQPYGDQLYPWRDGVFGPGLGRGLGQNGGGPTISLANAFVGNEIKAALNMLVSSYSATPGGAYDQATEAGYVTYIEEQTPGYPNKTELYQVADGHRYPSARGLVLLMGGARQAWATDVGYDESFVRVAQWYPLINAFVDGYEAAGYTGTVTLPTAANGNGNGGGNGNGNGDGGPMQASTVMLVGAGAVGIGLIAVLLRPKKKRRSTTPNRRRRRRR